MKYAVKCGKLYLALMENGGKEERCEDSRKQLRKLKKEFPNTVSETHLSKKIGATGFEPATSRPPAERATKLRHTPNRTSIV